MHILLPPSEGKRSGGRGRSLTAHPDAGPLALARTAALDSLATLLAGDPDVAAGALLLPPAVTADALAANAVVRTSPTTAALSRYAGVVYDGLAYGTLSHGARLLARRSVYIFSGLFGVVRGDENVPLYRVPAKAVLPRLGVAGTYWRPILSDLLPNLLGRGLIIDLRSNDYASMWRPDKAIRERVVSVRILSPTPTGTRAVISYPSKFGKGRLAGALLETLAGGTPITCPQDVADAWISCGGAAYELTGPGQLDLFAVQ
ncbi:MAG: peroxide stress protein YaaA [Jatrophihabitantaceae bacterium]